MNTPLVSSSASATTLAPVFRSREDFFAYQAAWRAVSARRFALPCGAYAAHALLTGRPLARAFSPSRRSGVPPHAGVARALMQVAAFSVRTWCSSQCRSLSLLDLREAGLSTEQAEILSTAWGALSQTLCGFYHDQKLNWTDELRAVAQGERPLPAATKVVAVRAVEES